MEAAFQIAEGEAPTEHELYKTAVAKNELGELFQKVTGKKNASRADGLLRGMHADLLGDEVDQELRRAADVDEAEEAAEEGDSFEVGAYPLSVVSRQGAEMSTARSTKEIGAACMGY